MSDKTKVTYDDVAKVADELVASGAEPSARKVYALLGRGSMGTVHKHFKQWQARRTSDGPVSMHVLPAALHKAVCAFVGDEVDKARQLYIADLQQANNDAMMLAEENERLTGELAAARDQIRMLEEQRATTNGRIGEMESAALALKEELAVERHAIAAVKEKLAAANGKLEFFDKRELEVEQLRAALDEERKARSQAERREAELIGKTAHLEQQPDAGKSTADKARGAPESRAADVTGVRRPKGKEHVAGTETAAAGFTGDQVRSDDAGDPRQISLLPPSDTGAAH